MTIEHVAQSTIEFGPPHTPEEAAEIRGRLRRYVADRRLLAERHDELLKQYEEQWAAMCDGALFTSPDLQGLLDAVKAGGAEPASAAVRFLTRTPLILVQTW